MWMFHRGLHPARPCSCWGHSGGVPERCPHTGSPLWGGRGGPAWDRHGGRFAAGLAVPPPAGICTRIPALHTSRGHRLPPAPATRRGHRADPRPTPRRMAGGDEKRHLLSEGPGGYGGAGGRLGMPSPLFAVRLPSGVWPGNGLGGSVRGASRSPESCQPQAALCPAGPTRGLRGRTGTTRSRDRSPPWSWGHGVASTATRGGAAATPAGSSGRAGSSTWPLASASSSWWGKPWVSAGCGVCWGVPVGSPRGAAQSPSCPEPLLWVWLPVGFLWVKTPGGTPLWHGAS